jgi:SAM-dependent methyltransferase
MDLDAFREQSLRTWDEMARGWEDRHEWLARMMGSVNDWIADRVDPQPGQVVLDVAAGPGDLGHSLATLVEPDGRVISTDFAPEMVEAARRLGQARGLDGVEYRTLDAERMDLDDDSVDVVVCRSGYMLMADPVAALRESRRVLREGGPLAFTVFATADRNPWAAVPAMTLVRRGQLPKPEPGAPGVFAMGEPDRIHELVTAGGFADPETDAIAFDFHYSDADDLWGSIVGLNGPLARVINALPAHERDSTRTAVIEDFAPYRNDDDSYTAPAVTWGVIAR